MSKLLRYPPIGDLYFITTVTAGRLPILLNNVDFFRASVEIAKSRLHFKEVAWVALPDHYHAVIQIETSDISMIMQTIKMSFSSQYRKENGLHSGYVWQRRFWDHIIRDQSDLNRHIDYIHYNPVKHGLTKNPFEYKYSSFNQFCKKGYYSKDWGKKAIKIIDGQFGE
jgi:putative transposase